MNPSFGHLIRILVSDREERRVREGAEQVRAAAATLARDRGATLLGPAPCPIAKVRNMIRYQLLVKLPEEDQLVGLVRELRTLAHGIRNLRVSLDVDPVSLL